ncbi:MAG: hypothetical protein JJE09_06180 [Bacteroidia bacterium]|nr:hypothetical protein [Bacteroidia bacterium]
MSRCRSKILLRLLLHGLLFIILSSVNAQDNSSGIFLKMKSGKKLDGFGKVVFTRDQNKSKSVVVPINPIVPTKEFVKISELTNNQKNNESYFYIWFSNEGVEVLKELGQVAGVQIVLIIDDTLVGEFRAGEIKNKSIQISGPANSADVFWAHFSIKKMIEDRSN